MTGEQTHWGGESFPQVLVGVNIEPSSIGRRNLYSLRLLRMSMRARGVHAVLEPDRHPDSNISLLLGQDRFAVTDGHGFRAIAVVNRSSELGGCDRPVGQVA